MDNKVKEFFETKEYSPGDSVEIEILGKKIQFVADSLDWGLITYEGKSELIPNDYVANYTYAKLLEDLGESPEFKALYAELEELWKQ